MLPPIQPIDVEITRPMKRQQTEGPERPLSPDSISPSSKKTNLLKPVDEPIEDVLPPMPDLETLENVLENVQVKIEMGTTVNPEGSGEPVSPNSGLPSKVDFDIETLEKISENVQINIEMDTTVNPEGSGEPVSPNSGLPSIKVDFELKGDLEQLLLKIFPNQDEDHPTAIMVKQFSVNHAHIFVDTCIPNIVEILNTNFNLEVSLNGEQKDIENLQSWTPPQRRVLGG